MGRVCLVESRGDKICSNNIISSSYSSFRSTKNPERGRWYYEYTQISGDQASSIGFMLNGNENCRFSLFQRANGNNNALYFEGISIYSMNDKTEIPENHPIGFDDITTGITVGVSYDTYTGLFTINIKDQIFSYIVSKITDNDKVEPILIEATGAQFKDNITVNFGPDFYYDIPQGYKPWCYNPHTQYFKHKNFKLCHIIIMLIRNTVEKN